MLGREREKEQIDQNSINYDYSELNNITIFIGTDKSMNRKDHIIKVRSIVNSGI